MGLEYGLTEEDVAFHKVSKVKSLLPILQDRLPISCNIFNMAKNHHKFQTEMSFYILTSSAQDTPKALQWIVATYRREDYGLDINVSAPSDYVPSSEMFKAALFKSKIVPLDEPFIFAAVESEICPLIQDFVLEFTNKNPCSCRNLMFYTTPLCQSLVTQFKLERSGVELEIKPLDPIIGSKFLVDNWAFAKSGSLAYVRKLIERNCSSGIFVNGKLVAGAAVNGSGMITMLHTLPKHRHNGYAQLCMNYISSSMFKDALIPCCTVEMTNNASISLQRKIGMKISHEAFYISRSTT